MAWHIVSLLKLAFLVGFFNDFSQAAGTDYPHKKTSDPEGSEAMRGTLCTQGRGRTDTGFTPLVFETSASTNSATWACKRTFFRSEDKSREQRFISQILFWVDQF
jgi:hypothetical protein